MAEHLITEEDNAHLAGLVAQGLPKKCLITDSENILTKPSTFDGKRYFNQEYEVIIEITGSVSIDKNLKKEVWDEIAKNSKRGVVQGYTIDTSNHRWMNPAELDEAKDELGLK